MKWFGLMGSFLEIKIKYIIAHPIKFVKGKAYILQDKIIKISTNEVILKISKIIAELTTLLI
jgi:hypothetical protein